MNRFCIKCPTCGHPIPAECYNRGEAAVPCEVCQAKLTIHALPAIYRSKRRSGAAVPAQLDDAVCFYHADKKAEQVCDDCGRFLCGFCELPFGNEVLCASCLAQRRKSESMTAFQPKQMRYDKLALMLAVGSLLMMVPFWFTVVIPSAVALAGVYVVIRYWKKKPALAGAYRSRMVVAMLLAFVAATCSILFALFMFREMIDG
ncbi:hypothetical protein [Pontiella sp.]|uniref:hypothetical protein n=1 Tax=Pontiella sp. TaxID=2837462 RepID=UPI003563ABE0